MAPSRLEPHDDAFAERVRASFARQGIMGTLGARLVRVEPGFVEIEVPYGRGLTQQHGFFHAGVVATIMDSAGGYASYTLVPAGSHVLTVEFKLNLTNPADGERVVARGRVAKPGRTLFVCTLEADVVKGGVATPCALGTQTIMRVDRPLGNGSPG